ncbi:hypothetical protein GOV14_05630 [Candidatus Pacearchaeota archaeon]|nr:hypothetical protein [Candidatus Pacearchaeota archaeon]
MSNGKEWFDEKYQQGGRPTLKDKSELFEQDLSEEKVKIPIKSRIGLERRLKQNLHLLKSKGDESAHVLAYHYLFCFGPLFLNEEKYREYVNSYMKIMKKHEKVCVLAHNYDQSVNT